MANVPGVQWTNQNDFARPMCKISEPCESKPATIAGETISTAASASCSTRAPGPVQSMVPASSHRDTAGARASEHPDMTEDLGEVLSTSVVDVECEVSTGVNVRDS